MAKAERSKRANSIIGRRFRYTSDYESVPTLTADGRRETALRYVGKWILPVNEASEYGRIVTLMRVGLIVAALAVIGAMLLIPAQMANRWYVPVLAVSFFPLAYEIMGAVKLPAKAKHMERAAYDKSFVRMGTSAMFALVVIGLAAVMFAVYWLFLAGKTEGAAPFSLRDGAFIALLAVAAAAEFLVYRQYRSLKTETLENKEYRP